MGKFANDPRRTLLRIKVGKRDFKGLCNLAQTVHDKITANAATFLTPLPTMANLLTHITALRGALVVTSNKRNHASKAAIQTTIDAAATVRTDLVALMNYVMNTAITTGTNNIDAGRIMALSGFALKKVRALSQQSQMPTFVQQNNNKIHTPNQYRLKWKKPLGRVKGLPLAGYNIRVGGVIVATTTNTFHVFPSLATPVLEGTITPFSARGEGKSVFFTVRGN